MAVLFYGSKITFLKKEKKMEKQKSGLATAGMVLGIIAIVGSWIPFLNIISIVLAVLAVIFGGVALIQKKGKGKAVAAVVLGGLSIIIAIYMLTAATTAIDDALNSSSSSSSSSSQERTSYDVDEAIVFDDKTVTVSNVERNWNSGNEFITPDTGNEFVRVQVEISNNSDDRISYNTFDWKIQNSNGTITDVDINSFGDGSLDSGELAAGGKVSGKLVFQAPSGDSGLTLLYEPSFWSNNGVEIKL